MKHLNGALTFSPSDDSTHMVGPSDNWSAVRLVLVTNSPSPKPKMDELLVHPKNKHLYPKIWDQQSQCDSLTHCYFCPHKL
jgi:hypothetical protein